MKDRRVLFVDDDNKLREVLKRELEDFGLEVHAFADPKVALAHLERHPVDVALIDLRLPGMDGLQLLERLRALDEALPVVMLTGHGAVREAVEAMRRGAHDFLTKPVSLEALERILARACGQRDLLQENRRLRRLTDTDEDEVRILGDAPPTRALRELIERVAPSDASVLVVGESGTGKELVARAIHSKSPRAARPFVVVHCGAIPESLIESELFGHERGAFTGADRRRTGLFEAAHGGTLFLDELGELPLAVQPVLLRAIQFGELRSRSTPATSARRRPSSACRRRRSTASWRSTRARTERPSPARHRAARTTLSTAPRPKGRAAPSSARRPSGAARADVARARSSRRARRWGRPVRSRPAPGCSSAARESPGGGSRGGLSAAQVADAEVGDRAGLLAQVRPPEAVVLGLDQRGSRAGRGGLAAGRRRDGADQREEERAERNEGSHGKRAARMGVELADGVENAAREIEVAESVVRQWESA